MAGQLSGETRELPPYQMVRRQRILDAAKTLLKSNDYESIQIRDVAAEAKVALGTLYRYFASKEQVYANVVYDWAVPFGATDQLSAENLGTTEQISRRLHIALVAFERQPNFYKVILVLRSTLDPSISAIMRRMGEALEAPIRADLARLNPEESEDITAMVWCVLMDLVARLLLGEKTMAEAIRIADRFVSILGLRLAQLETTNS